MSSYPMSFPTNAMSNRKTISMMGKCLLFSSALVYLPACQKEDIENLKEIATPPVSTVSISAETFGLMPDGSEVIRYTLTNSDKTRVKILNFGGIIQTLMLPDRDGKLTDVVLGFDTLAEYLQDQRYFGPLIGRYANRIEFGRYSYKNQVVQLEANRKGHHLHGGSHGAHKVLWASESFLKEHSAGVKLIYFSPDGKNGYPGNMEVTATYELNDNNELSLTFTATTDKATPVSFTNHSYFNLAGQGTALNQRLQIHAQWFTPLSNTLIPTGEIAPVKNTPFDFQQPKVLADNINTEHEQLALGKGFDHNWVIKREQNADILPMATLVEPVSGRKMEILSNAPGLQFYSGNFLNKDIIGKGDQVYDYRTGIVLEPQQFPNAPNEESFPNPFLLPNEIYHHTIIYRFSVEAETP